MLLGYVDDEEKHGDYAYQEDLAQQGYTVAVTAADGYSVSFDSQLLNRNDKIIVAAQMNENPLDDEFFPLRLVGGELSKKEMVGQIAQIQLDFSGGATTGAVKEPSPTPEPVAAEDSAASGGETALVIEGAVGKEKVWTLDEFKKLGLVEMIVEHPKTVPVLVFERFAGFGLEAARPVAVILILASLAVFILLQFLLNARKRIAPGNN
jgi:hypothetical protein